MQISGQTNALALLHGLEVLNYANMSVLQYISPFPVWKHIQLPIRKGTVMDDVVQKKKNN